MGTSDAGGTIPIFFYRNCCGTYCNTLVNYKKTTAPLRTDPNRSVGVPPSAILVTIFPPRHGSLTGTITTFASLFSARSFPNMWGLG